MKLLRAIWTEALGLFVDDGAYAGAIVVWLAVVGALVRFTPIGGTAGPLLAIGLAAILGHGALRKSRK